MPGEKAQRRTKTQQKAARAAERAAANNNQLETTAPSSVLPSQPARKRTATVTSGDSVAIPAVKRPRG